MLVDADDNSFIDLGSGIAVTNVGNAAPLVVDGIVDSARMFTHTCFMVTPYAGYVEVCEQLNELTPGDHAKRSALFSSGAEAVENAVKIARHYTGKQAVVAVEHGYHGRTNLTMALTAKNMPYKDRFGPFAPEVYRVPTSYPFRDGGLDGAAAAKAALTKIDKEVGVNNLAAIIIEPIQGEGGFIVPAPGFLPAIADWCSENGVVFIADEVQSGWCRTGDWFACDNEGVVPDLMTLAKGMGDGMPIAAVTGRAEIMDAVHTGGLGGTYGGNPVACAAALGAIQTMRDEDACARAREIEQIMIPRLRSMAEKIPAIGDVRGRGAMIAIEMVKPGTLDPDPELTAQVAKACHSEGVLVLTAGTYGNVMRFLPPLSMPHDLLKEALDVLEKAFLTATSAA